jgi:hypothetical protein
LLRGQVAKYGSTGITWENLPGQEYDQADNPQREDHQAQASQKEQSQWCPPLGPDAPYRE